MQGFEQFGRSGNQAGVLQYGRTGRIMTASVDVGDNAAFCSFHAKMRSFAFSLLTCYNPGAGGMLAHQRPPSAFEIAFASRSRTAFVFSNTLSNSLSAALQAARSWGAAAIR